MKKHNIPPEKRWALWETHKRKCQYCLEPLSYSDFWVEHILPEHLGSNKPRLLKILVDYGLDSDFDINSYDNWLPTHMKCNKAKGSRVRDKSATLHFIDIARSKSEKAKRNEIKFVESTARTELFFAIETGLKKGLITKKELKEKILFFSNLGVGVTNSTASLNPLVVTFGLELEAVYKNTNTDGIPALPSGYDWLEKDLIENLSSTLSGAFYYTEASERNGESLSVRLAFNDLNLAELDLFESEWWKILEISFFDDIYEGLEGYDDWFEPYNEE